MEHAAITRRRFSGEILALGLTLGGSAAEATETLPIDELRLPIELRAELQRAAAGLIEEARSLADLPLNGIEPFFTFPRE